MFIRGLRWEITSRVPPPPPPPPCAGTKMLTVAGTGTFETDYGVSSSSDHDETYSPPPGSSASSTDDDHLHDFAPPSTIPRKRFAGSKALKPLTILNENISRSTKFHNLFSVPLHPHPQRPVFPRAVCHSTLTIDILQSECASPRNSPFPGTSAVYHLHLTVTVRETHAVALSPRGLAADRGRLY